MPEIHLQPLLGTEEGGVHGKVAVADFPYTIGRRRGCDLRISNSQVSRVHCRLSLLDRQVCVEDMGSLNGTFVNEEPVKAPLPLHDGDVLRVAYVVFKVHMATDEATAVQPPGGGRRVLVVEDDENAAESLALLLRTWGYEVSVAHDGPEALRAAQDHPPDSVLVDIRLPGMDGYQVARRLREQASMVRARIVGMTGCPEEAERLSCENVGVQKVMLKPVGAEILREAVGG